MKYLKLYCPECGKEIDETEFMEFDELCAICYLNDQNMTQEDISNES
ncbi:hypothetical protein LCGC14_1752030 [marine sediment metagenome]|uniref:Uncharacterized protein n=1 Tax=marine sediment metagenome TaxID=412755 RepID=A0A0F9H3R0_9ZZZZ